METINIPIDEQLEAMKKQKPIMEKLGLIQQELFVPKDQDNNYGGYKYRSCEDILKAVKPICEKHKCILRLGDAVPVVMEGRFYIKTMVQLYDTESCTSTSTTAYAREEETKKGMDGSQITGSAISYARKYALAGLFCIDNEKDSDSTNTKNKDGIDMEEVQKTKAKTASKAKPAKPETVSREQINAIMAELDRTGVSMSAVLDMVKKDKIADMTVDEYTKIIHKLNISSDKEG